MSQSAAAPRRTQPQAERQSDSDGAFLDGSDRRLTLALMSLAALYLGGILNPMTNLRHFPIALVNGTPRAAGQQIVDGLVSGLTRTSSTSEWFLPDEAMAARHRGVAARR